MSQGVTRKLAAILAADAVGYSRLMAENEENTVRVLSAHRAVIDGIIEFHHGRIVGTAGDSVLAEFASPVEALRCAVEIQEALKTRNASLAEGSRLHFRIGINLGDVVVKGSDLLGDGVNVAARLEGIAEPGGICISSSVYDQIAGKLDLGFVEMGEQSLKNIGRPIRVYRVAPGSSGTTRAKRPLRGRGIAFGVGAAAALAALAWIRWGSDPPALDVRPIAPVPVAASKPSPQNANGTAADDESRSRIAAQRLEAEQRDAEAAIASTNARAALEIAKARADAQMSRARADAEALRRQAAIEIAAAREAAAKPRVANAAPPSPATAAPPSSSASAPMQAAPAIAQIATPLAVKTAAVAPESWTGTMRCDPFRGAEQVTDEIRVRREGDAFMLDRRPAGAPGHLTAHGAPSRDGKLELIGEVISPRGNLRGQEVPVRLEGSLDAGRYVTRGHLGARPCVVVIARTR